MKTCENCNSLNVGDYGSGRFCSSKCARGFSTKNKRSEINKKVSLKLFGSGNKDIIKICSTCKENFSVSFKNRNKIFCSKNCIKKPRVINIVNKICNHCNKNFITKTKIQKFCSKSCSTTHKNTVLSEETKKKISISIKQAYSNGKLVYGGWCKWIEVETSNGKIKVQGSFEVRACKILDKLKENNIIKVWEYTTDRIKYIGLDFKHHNYLLDFKIFENDNTFYYLEIKGYEKQTDKLKWAAVRNNGNGLIIWFDKELKELEMNLL